jgi:hypothetical protein
MRSACKAWDGVRAAGFAFLAAAPAFAASSPDLVPVRAGVRSQPIAALSAGSAGLSCLSGTVQSLRLERQKGTALQRRALLALTNDPALFGERMVLDAEGITVRFTTDRNSPDRVEPADDNANGRPDAVDDALAGIARARQLLIGQLELASPGGIDIVLSRLGSGVDGVSIPGSVRPARSHMWLDPSPRGGILRAAEHQYAHNVAATAGLNPFWSEAFATWTVIALEGTPDDRTLSSIAGRLASDGAGLVTQDLEFASGNAAWFTFLNDAYGPTMVKLAVEELGRGGSDQAALDRATRRATGDPLDAALRNFHVWSILVGPRDDHRHFTFAGRLPAQTVAATAEAFPVLSVQTEPEIGPMGQAAILLRPDEVAGGMTIRFEGDLAARWAADVLIVHSGGELRRVGMTLDGEDSGEISIPLQDVREMLLLVRNLDSEGHPARRYTWGAQVDARFPVEFGSVRAEAARDGNGALVSWETATERGLLGFNVLRSTSDRTDPTRVNPVWIPAVGETSGPAAYSFFDAGTESGVPYRYRIEAVTLEGLASRSDAAVLTPAP